MARFYGIVGFEVQRETRPSIYTPEIVERSYSGKVLKNYRRTDSGEGVNDDVNLNNEISILADVYARNHFQSIRYVKWYGAYWKVNAVTANPPRLKLTIGGVYNGPTRET